MRFEIILTGSFNQKVKSLIKRYASIKADLMRLRTELLENPQAGQALGHDCYKIRMRIGAKNVGKSGGAKVITCVKLVGDKIYLLTVYDKAEQSTVTDNERDELLRENGLL